MSETQRCDRCGTTMIPDKMQEIVMCPNPFCRISVDSTPEQAPGFEALVEQALPCLWWYPGAPRTDCGGPQDEPDDYPCSACQHRTALLSAVAALRAERDAARATNQRLNRRAQVAEDARGRTEFFQEMIRAQAQCEVAEKKLQQAEARAATVGEQERDRALRWAHQNGLQDFSFDDPGGTFESVEQYVARGLAALRAEEQP